MAHNPQHDDDCGCCEGVEILTPATLYNRPGLDALRYRVGTHGSFLESMKAALSGQTITLKISDENGDEQTVSYSPLDDLTARTPDDFSIALLDVWATIADVLTFYQERIANEGYLQTAIERRSVLELARLIGYKLRPGVASTVLLAYTVDESARRTLIPLGTRAQTVPAPGETMQSFETSEDLTARPEWNSLKLRTSQPTLALVSGAGAGRHVLLPPDIYLQGTASPLRPNERVLLVFGTLKPNPDGGAPLPFTLDEEAVYLVGKVNASEIQTEANRTHVALQDLSRHLVEILTPVVEEADPAVFIEGPGAGSVSNLFLPSLFFPRDPFVDRFVGMRSTLEKPYIFTSWTDKIGIAKKTKSVPPVSAAKLQLSPQQTLVADADLIGQALSAQNNQLAEVIYAIIGSEIAPPPDDVAMLRQAYVFHKKAALFGHNAPPNNEFQRINGSSPPQYRIIPGEWATNAQGAANLFAVPQENPPDDIGESTILTLDAEYDEIVPESLLLLQWRNSMGSFSAIYQIIEANSVSAVAFGLTAKATQVIATRIKGAKWTPSSDNRGQLIDNIRSTVVYAVSERLGDSQSGKVLADEPLPNEFSVDDVGGNEIELDGVYDGLKAGRHITITGIRTDISGGMVDSESAMLVGVVHRINQIVLKTPDETETVYEGVHPGDVRHTVLRLERALNYTYQRDSVVINANVVRATHGESKNEVLGGGIGAQANQYFTLKQPSASQPLTFVPAVTVSGIETTLAVRVNDVLWHQAETLAGKTPTDHVYVADIDNDGKVSVTFGNGREGARLPTGKENVRASYRVGIGKSGNVRAKQISLLASRPPGVKEIINPLPATGGADPENIDQARRNAPLAVLSLDRLVSLRDYSDFARTFAGIGKARARRDNQGGVMVIVGGEDNIPITEDSELIRNLDAALQLYGDPNIPVQVKIYETRVMVVGAAIQVHPDYRWDKVKPKVADALLKWFAYNQRDFGQPVTIGEVLAAIQSVAGVEYAEMTALDALTEAALVQIGKPPPAQQPGVVNPGTTSRFLTQTRVDVLPYELAYADPKLPDLLILSEMTV